MDGALKAVPYQLGQQAGVVQVSVGENHGIQGPGQVSEGAAVGLVGLGSALLNAALQQQAVLPDFQQIA